MFKSYDYEHITIGLSMALSLHPFVIISNDILFFLGNLGFFGGGGILVMVSLIIFHWLSRN